MAMGSLFVIAFLMLPGMAAFAQEKDAAGARPGTVVSIELPDIPTVLKEGENRITVETHCAVCHSVDYIPMQPPMTREQWSAGVNKMIKTFGAQIGPDDAEKIIEYLNVNYGAGK